MAADSGCSETNMAWPWSYLDPNPCSTSFQLEEPVTKLLHLPESLCSHLQDGDNASLMGLLRGLVGMTFVKILVDTFEMETSTKWK